MALMVDSILADDYRHCEDMARRHYENFSVLSVFIPPELRPHFSALYAFCRGVDDLGDEYAGDRPAALTAWREELDRAYAGTAKRAGFLALSHTIQLFHLPYEEFDKLIRANEMDQEGRRCQTFGDTLEYCRHSANPVGRLVLGLFGYSDPDRYLLSDATCTALQLANFLQDMREDLLRGRHYWPEEDLARFGLTGDKLAGYVQSGTPMLDAEAVSAWGLFECDRMAALFRKGAMLETRVPKRLGLQLKLYRLGGEAVVGALRRQQGNPFLGRPVVSRAQKLRIIGAVAGGMVRSGQVPST